ncbi:hypothetical protein C0J52_11344 [Blattella germanica]|nr:hypothetical protein C0J52_11344 [Blattella germanica]
MRVLGISIIITLMGFKLHVEGLYAPITSSCALFTKLCPEFASKFNKVQNFLLTGNLNMGKEIMKHCKTTIFNIKNRLTTTKKICNTEMLKNMCWFLDEMFEIAKKWKILELRRQQWLKLNNSVRMHSVRLAKNKFDNFAEYLNLVSDKIRNIRQLSATKNLICLFNQSFLMNISKPEYCKWIGRYEQRKQFIKSAQIEFYSKTALFCLILILGLIGNSITIYLFCKHKILRTSPNILLLNLVIVDILNLMLSLPFGYIEYFLTLKSSVSFSTIACQIFIFSEQLFNGLCIWSLVAMSILKYKAVRPSLLFTWNEISKKYEILFYVSAVWIIGFVLPLPTTVAIGSFSGHCQIVADRKFLTHWNLLLYSIIPLLVVVLLYALTARHLVKSAEQMPGQDHGQEIHKKSRSRGAKVLVTLTVIFAICYPPPYIYRFLIYWNFMKDSHFTFKIHVIFHYLSYLNSAINPIVLYTGCATYREFLKFHLRRLFCSATNSHSGSNSPLQQTGNSTNLSSQTELL